MQLERPIHLTHQRHDSWAGCPVQPQAKPPARSTDVLGWSLRNTPRGVANITHLRDGAVQRMNTTGSYTKSLQLDKSNVDGWKDEARLGARDFAFAP